MHVCTLSRTHAHMRTHAHTHTCTHTHTRTHTRMHTHTHTPTCRLCVCVRLSSSRLSLEARVEAEREKAFFMLIAPWLSLHWMQYISYSSSTWNTWPYCSTTSHTAPPPKTQSTTVVLQSYNSSTSVPQLLTYCLMSKAAAYLKIHLFYRQTCFMFVHWTLH